MSARIIPLRRAGGAPPDPYRTPVGLVTGPRLRTRRRTGLVVAVVITAVLVTLLLLALFISARHQPPDSAGTASSAPAATPFSGGGLTWQRVQGVYFPVSSTDGPSRIDGQLVAGFAESDLGAALAAVHIVYRATAAPGPSVFGPTLHEQVVGPGARDLAAAVEAEYAQARETSGLPDGAPLGDGSATFIGYRAAPLPGGNRQVQVVERSPDENGVAQFYAFDVVLTRLDGDWKVVAPSTGTWNSAFSRLPNAPADMVAFQPAAPTGGP